MLCSHCKAPIKEGDTFCSNCGQKISTTITESKKGAAWWVKMFAAVVVFCAIIFGLKSFTAHDELDDAIQGQLIALRNNHLTEAYYEYGSHEFEENITLNAFREYVQQYPILTHNNGIHFTERKIENNVAEVKGTLSGTDNAIVPIEYTLVKEKDKWKILNIQLPALASLSTSAADIHELTDQKIRSELESLLNTQLKAIRENDVTRAYQDYSDTKFREATSLEKFTTFVKQLPILSTFEKVNIISMLTQGNVVEANVTLEQGKIVTPLIYEFVQENGVWKIKSMIVAEPPSAAVMALLKDPEAMRKPVEEQLKALKDNDVSKAYSYATKEFREITSQDAFGAFLKRYPILSHYDSFDIKELQEGVLEVHLKDNTGTTTFEYFMGIEDDQWKINGLRAQPKRTIES